jgi:hypothetical protein
MKKKIILAFIFIGIIMFSGCSKEPEISKDEKDYQKKYVDFSDKLKVEKNNIIQYIDEISSEKYEGRKTGTKGEAEAALYLASFLKDHGIEPYTEGSYFQVFTDPDTGIEGDNVLGILKYPERHKYIVISAHYDYLGRENGGKERILPGANQNASGVSAVMEAARVLSKNFDSMEYNVVFAFFSGHEQNLAGSKAYFDFLTETEKKNIKFMVNLDTIGSFGDKNYIIWRENELSKNEISEFMSWKDFSIKPSARGADNSDHYHFGKNNISAITIRSQDWETGAGTIGDTRYGVNIDNVRMLTQNLVNYIYNLEGEEDAG